jgi:alkylhydroperoxidase family enzyme
MKRTSMAGLLAGSGIWILLAGLLLVALRIPAQAEDGSSRESAEPQPSANEGLIAVPADSAQPVTPNAGIPSAHSTPEPSLEQVMELLQAQGRELETLRAALREQQELTARLVDRLNSTGAGEVAAESGAAALAVSPSNVAQEDLAQKVAKLETDLGKSQKDLGERLKTLGPFVFSGDLRLRAEPTFGGPSDRSQDRFRERIRLRFNAEAQLNDQLKGGFSFASGDLNNPISTNQTTNQYTTRKPLTIDRAFATYNPSWFRPLTVTGGKFAYPWFNTELVWDKDLNPEGAGETLAFNVKTPLLKKFSVVGFQAPFAENKRTAVNDKSFYNTMVYGEQLQTFWQLGSRVKLSAYTSFYDWKYADSIALSVATANIASPDNGLLALNNNGLQNSIATVTVTNAATGAKTITSAQFASKFGILDSLAQFDIQTPYERWPVIFVGDFAQNTRACENLRNIPVAAGFSAPCDTHARHGYWLEGRIGRADRKGDWQFGYTRIVIEREAVIGAFNYSEIFPANNIEIHRAEVLYQLFRNVTLQLNALVGRPLVTAGSPPPVQPLWERLQFDVTYKF